jgi:phosphate transport system protein
MSIHLQKEMEKLKKKFLTLSAIVEENLNAAMYSVLNCDLSQAEQVARRDNEIDNMEVEIEEECLKVLALHQPVAVDLRFLVAVLKINNDLERIGDQAVNIAKKVKSICIEKRAVNTVDFQVMFKSVQKMVKQSLDALINIDVMQARSVCTMDDDVDRMKRDMREQVFASIIEMPEKAKSLYAVMGVARNLERIADLATNIAEDVIYMVEGNIVRHHRDDQ